MIGWLNLPALNRCWLKGSVRFLPPRLPALQAAALELA